ncbi:MAG: phage head closure protein [Oscillospiraceae bacterium]|nr:phage head closure protein [Oscillospiraceae bacterium]
MARYDDAAQLNRRVTFQRFIGDADLVGDYQYLDDENWEDVVTVWAEVKSISSRTFDTAGQEQSEVTHNIKIRYRSWDYNVVNMRAVQLGKKYRLLSPPLDLADGKVYQLIKAAEVWR